MANRALPEMAGRALPDVGGAAAMYGLPPGGAPAAPAPVAPAASAADPAALYGMAAPSFTNVQAGGAPPGGMDTTFGGASTAPPAGGIGDNTFGVHPKVDLHAIAAYLLPKVRNVESRGDYKADRSKTHPGQTASGGYQYIDSAWNGYGGFKRAVDAPPEVQDARAKEDFLKNLQKFGGDPFKAVASHYYPKYAGNPTMWDKPLVDGKGLPIKGAPTVAEYVSNIIPKERLAAYMSAQNSGGVGTGSAP